MGVLAFAAGIVTLVWPHVTLGVLAVIMGIWLIIYGVLEIVLSLPAAPLGRGLVRAGPWPPAPSWSATAARARVTCSGGERRVPESSVGGGQRA